MTPTIETPRLLLRQWRDADMEPWAAMCADARVMQFLGPPVDRAKAISDANMLASRLEQNGYGWWVVEAKNQCPFVGLVALQDVPFEAPFTPALEVGWRLASDHWGTASRQKEHVPPSRSPFENSSATKSLQ